jgi:hypothetical protein
MRAAGQSPVGPDDVGAGGIVREPEYGEGLVALSLADHDLTSPDLG